MSKEMSDELEQSMKEFAAFLCRLSGWNAVEVEFEMRTLIDKFNNFTKEVRPGEVPVLQQMIHLVQGHAHTAIIDKGIDPFTMGPLVKLESDELSF